MICTICKKREAQELSHCFNCQVKRKHVYNDDYVKGKYIITTKDGLIVLQTNNIKRANTYMKMFGDARGFKIK